MRTFYHVPSLHSMPRHRLCFLLIVACVLCYAFTLFVSMFRLRPSSVLVDEENADFDTIQSKLMHIKRNQFNGIPIDSESTDRKEQTAAEESKVNNQLKDFTLTNISNVLGREDSCRNSIQGRELIADERGYVCTREALTGGCCRLSDTRTRPQYSCETCFKSCCKQFEYCISCCLHPERKPLLRKVLIKQQKMAAGDEEVIEPNHYGTLSGVAKAGAVRIQALFNLITDHFEFCLAKCRTSSQSVPHENTYLNALRKHCFGIESSDSENLT